MQENTIPIICGDKIDNDIDYIDAIPNNMIAVARNVLGDQGYLLSHDGLTSYLSGQGADRGALYNERWKRSFRVSGDKLIELTTGPGYGTVIIGTIPGVKKCIFAYSFQSIMIIADGNAYRYDGTTLTQMTDPDLGHPISVTWIDSYYMFTDGEYLYHTDINNETSIDPLKFASAEISPDPLRSVYRTQDDLVAAFGRYTIEYFINQGNPNFAFSRINQKALSAGVVGVSSWCEMNGSLFILGGRKEESCSVHMIGAGQTISVSTRYIDKIITSYTEEQLFYSVLECRIINQDKLIYVYLPNEVLVYNHTIAEGSSPQYAWSRLTTGTGKWQACNGIYDPLLNKWIYGDISTTNICYLNDGLASQYNQPVQTEFCSPLIPLEGMSIDEVELNTISGFQSEENRMFISSTRDGAIYSKEWSREVATQYNYDLRCIFRRLGFVRKKIGFKFRALNSGKINASNMVLRYGK